MSLITTTGKIVSGGLGGFLNPPGHPENSFHVETDLGPRLSLSSAVNRDWLDSKTRQSAEQMLQQWEAGKSLISDPDVQNWIRAVLGYFKFCYIRPYFSHNANDLLISLKLNPLANAHTHAGVHFIRAFYPEFHPSSQHFEEAYWGRYPS
jgi:hypothetical protein